MSRRLILLLFMVRLLWGLWQWYSEKAGGGNRTRPAGAFCSSRAFWMGGGLVGRPPWAAAGLLAGFGASGSVEQRPARGRPRPGGGRPTKTQGTQQQDGQIQWHCALLGRATIPHRG